MTKTEFAFRTSCEILFEQEPEVYFWTFTFIRPMPDWWYANTWQAFIRDLQRLYGGELRGIKVTELHQTHGIHFHALLNHRVWVGEVRRLCKRYGLGRVHVEKCDRNAIDYLAKYLSKQHTKGQKLFCGIRRWHTIGAFRGCKVRNVEIRSEFTRRLKVAREALGMRAWPTKLYHKVRKEIIRADPTDKELELTAGYYECTGRTDYNVQAARDFYYRMLPPSQRHGLEPVSVESHLKALAR